QPRLGTSHTPGLQVIRRDSAAADRPPPCQHAAAGPAPGPLSAHLFTNRAMFRYVGCGRAGYRPVLPSCSRLATARAGAFLDPYS
ncbi:MAG: hypothetical protein ACK56F_22275, partial [bacterium]